MLPLRAAFIRRPLPLQPPHGQIMLTAYIYDGHLRRLTEITEPGALRNAIWIDAAQPTSDEARRIEIETSLAVPSEALVNEIESSSRLSRRDGALYLNMPLISSDFRPNTVGFVLTRDRLLTVRFASSL